MTIAQLRKILDKRDAEVWTQPNRDAIESLARRYMNGDDSETLLTEAKALVPPRSMLDADSSRSIFGAWLMNRASRTVKKLLDP